MKLAPGCHCRDLSLASERQVRTHEGRPGRAGKLKLPDRPTLIGASKAVKVENASEGGWGDAEVASEIVARNAAVTNEPVRFDLRISGSSCKLRGMAIPATVG